MAGIKLILELDTGVKDVPTLVGLINDRFRDLGEDLKILVANPATSDVDLGGFQIHNVADPSNDLDAVNLRTLGRRIAPGDSNLTQAPAASAFDGVTFGLDSDAAGQGPLGDGTDAIGKRATVLTPGSPYFGAIACGGVPTTQPTILDVLFSHDKGLTWTSCFNGDKATFGLTDVGRVMLPRSSFANVRFAVGDLLRVDIIQTGGATDITLELLWK